ncbi:hypothetical protein N7462_001317 [Penicillium macrosclerotiorum]|uniref:uncharacterized protein n=1 Tax=Penicillium macrosclerotiorum TaxID=303699 RepID=UPI0025487C37|nr:uncharacterized protein N7462_001317 [Penicillium macrosclerotiorum]KAJ5691894.1 hypothetical protein N7462_001317 [Penicillium macrosclerotiorum]
MRRYHEFLAPFPATPKPDRVVRGAIQAGQSCLFNTETGPSFATFGLLQDSRTTPRSALFRMPSAKYTRWLIGGDLPRWTSNPPQGARNRVYVAVTLAVDSEDQLSLLRIAEGSKNILYSAISIIGSEIQAVLGNLQN